MTGFFTAFERKGKRRAKGKFKQPPFTRSRLPPSTATASRNTVELDSLPIIQGNSLASLGSFFLQVHSCPHLMKSSLADCQTTEFENKKHTETWWQGCFCRMCKQSEIHWDLECGAALTAGRVKGLSCSQMSGNTDGGSTQGEYAYTRKPSKQQQPGRSHSWTFPRLPSLSLKHCFCWAWWCTFATPALLKLRQENCY